MKRLFVMTLFACSGLLQAQEFPSNDKFSVWFPLQFVPNLTLLSNQTGSHFGFEWEATPVLYSFGMTKNISPWYAFIIEPTARFTGSLELQIAGQVFTTKPGRSHFGSSAQLTAYIPLIERGEHLTLNLGGGFYFLGRENRFVTTGGISTLFGLLHLTVKHAGNPTLWITSLEFRIF